MKYVDEYRDPDQCRQLVATIRRMASRTWQVMEVCGGQTHGLLRHGIDQALEGKVHLIHGPGCPVCVTPLESIDHAIALAERPEVVLTSFGDMLRVPGSQTSLLRIRATGADIRIVYSPLDAVQLAVADRDRHVVFFAVGFETTMPATALAVQQAAQLQLNNFSLLVAHVRVLPAMEMLAANASHAIDGFLAAGHVCTVTGYACYEPFVERFHLPVVVTGFEPVDLLMGILDCVRQLERGTTRVTNCYSRSVVASGNRQARAAIEAIYEPCDRAWRGIGAVPMGGFRLQDKWAAFDAARRFPHPVQPVHESPDCRSGDVLTGRIKPIECPCFGTTCTPENPLGAPMVSAEGACAAYYQFKSD